MKGKARRQSLVILGNGMAAGRLLDELAARGAAERYDLTVVGEEPQGSYNRILLSSLLAGEAAIEDIIQKSPRWYRANGIQFINARAHRIDPRHKRISCGGGVDVLYDHLVIATGSRPARIAAANQQLKGIFHFRGIADVAAIEERAAGAKQGVVIGGGLLGLEAAWGLARKGIEVTVVHRNAWLMNRQLDRTAAGLLEDALAEHGIRVRLACEALAFNAGAAGEVSSVTLSDGATLPAGIAVIATGITPNAELGLEAGLRGGRAIHVDDHLRTSDAAISALGECVEHEGKTFGLVEPIWEQCAVLAARLAGEQGAPFRQRAHCTRLKVSGIQVFSMGELESGGDLRAVELLDSRQRVYRKLLMRGDRLCGAVLFGDVRGGLDYLRMMQEDQRCAAEVPRLLLTGAAAPARAEPVLQAG